MDRNKPSTGVRGPKSKVTQQPPDTFIALGTKPSSSRDVDPKRSGSLSKPTPHLPPSTSKVVPERKREASSSLPGIPPSKKIKSGISNRSPTIGVPNAPSHIVGDRPGVASSAGVEPWESLIVDCDSNELFENVITSVNNGNMDKAVGYILGAIKLFRGQRFKPDKMVYNSLLLICQCKPSLFINENVCNAIVSVMRRDLSTGFKTPNKGNVYTHILFVNLLTRAFDDVFHWPEVFVKLYVEDALGDRVWIDNPFCKSFVDNIVTAFNTKQPPKILLTSETWLATGRDTSSPLTVNTSLEDDDVFNEYKSIVENWKLKVLPRYAQSLEVVEKIAVEAIQEQISRRQQPEAITKNFVRFLSNACGLVEIRIFSISRIETWLHNHKLMKAAQELLAYVCYNCAARTQKDVEVVAQLSKLRLKSKPLVNMFNNCLKEMVISFPENLYPLLKYTIYNELSNARNTNNLVVVGAMFQVAPDASADAFADICLELLLNKDDYLRSLRALLKEINRVLRHDFNLLSVVHALLRERPEVSSVIREFEFRDRMFYSLADLVCMCMLLCVNPQVRDAATQSKRDVSILRAFQLQVSNIQREAVTWLHDSAIRLFRPNQTDFVHILHKVLFLVASDEYTKVDSWPGENERNLFLRLSSEVPLLQATLLRILLIGLSKEHPMGQADVMETLDQLVKRVANLAPDCTPPLVMDKTEIVDFFFNLSSFNQPENIILPVGFVPPTVAISNLLWKAWLILLILAAHNPTTFGSLAWNKYPTLRTLMEMCITNHFSFPPPTMLAGTETVEDYISKEMQTNTIERQTIFEYESLLAAASKTEEPTEQKSFLLPNLMELKPLEAARKPPPTVLEQLGVLNTSHRLGHLLCRSRNPDFLLDIMSRQGGTAHMPWLAELIHNSEGAFAHLPVQCLCEYLLSTMPTEKLTKHGQLLFHLRTVVNGPDPQSASEVLEYLLRRLTSIHAASRNQAIKGLTLILNPNEDNEIGEIGNDTQWLTRFIPAFVHANTVRPLLAQFLRQALFVETNPVHISDYVLFLSSQDLEETIPDLLELVLDLASIIVERSCITSHVLPGDNMDTLKALITLFCFYLQKARQPTDETFHWCESQDQVVVTWANGDQSTLQILIVHASIILLTFGPIENFVNFDILMDAWFPINEDHPKAYLVDTSEEALLVPDWLKLRMIRSMVPRLVDSAINKLEAPQLVLFIQSFGIPVVSISKLLNALDKVTMVDTKLVVDSVLDKNYMIQLVEVQNRRGAQGGEIFVKSLELQAPNLDDDDCSNMSYSKPKLNDFNKTDVSKKTDFNEIIKIFNNLFLNTENHGNKKKDFRRLMNIISADVSLKNFIYQYLSNASSSNLQVLVNNLQYSITLFKFLFNKIYNEPAIASAKILLTKLPATNNPLTLTVKQFLKQNKIKDTKQESDTIETILSKPVVTNQMIGRVSETSETITKKLGKLLVENDLNDEKVGLIVDWLYSIQLEVTNLNEKNVQMDLLFSKRGLPFRPSLISLLLQRGNWSTLYMIVEYLLKDINACYCPTSTLDFLTALTQSPRLWQGRDKSVPKHHHVENVLNLNPQQIIVVISSIIEEAKGNDENWKIKMESRLSLLLEFMDGKCDDKIALHLVDNAQTDLKYQELLLMLYLSIPAMVKNLTNFDKENLTKEIYSKTTFNVVDVLSHNLINALTPTARSKDWARKSLDLDLCVRKLTSTHPELVLRQLGMLAGCLKGRALYDLQVLKTKGHLLLFGQILGLLELLQPIVFQQNDLFCSVLDSFFDLLQFQGQAKELTLILNRIVVILQNWMIADVNSALKYLQKYGPLLNELQLSQPSVRPLLSSVSLPVQDQNAPGELLVGTATPPVPEPLPQQWPSILASLQSQDILPGLADLEHLTPKKPHLLMHVSQHLYNCLNSSNNNVRATSLILIIRLLRHNPRESSKALSPILMCLNSKNPEVVASILERMPELIICMQEHAKLILTRAFQLAVNSNLHASTSLTKTISLLSLQYGC